MCNYIGVRAFSRFRISHDARRNPSEEHRQPAAEGSSSDTSLHRNSNAPRYRRSRATPRVRADDLRDASPPDARQCSRRGTREQDTNQT